MELWGAAAYRTARICLNGHVRSEGIEEDPVGEPFCQECGAETLVACKCGAPIRGYFYVPEVIGATEYRRPAYCHACGDPYPWTAKAKRAFVDLVGELDGLKPEEREQLQASAEDLIAETPGTAVAVVRVKKALQRVSKEVAPILLRLVEQMASDAVWRQFRG